MVSTVKKSQAMIPLAWAVRNCRQVGPARRGAGSMPAAVRIYPHGGRGDAVTESDQLALDSPVTPAGIVLGHANDKRLGRCRGRPTTRPAPIAVVSLTGHQVAVPPQQRRRSDSEDLRPSATGDPTRQSSQPDPVRRRVAHPVDLSTQDRVFVPQHQQLRVLGHLPTTDHRQRAKKSTRQPIQQKQQHSVMISAH